LTADSRGGVNSAIILCMMPDAYWNSVNSSIVGEVRMGRRRVDIHLPDAEELVDEPPALDGHEHQSSVCMEHAMPYPAPTKIVPMTHVRKVLALMDRSSWLSTTARTSAYGEFLIKKICTYLDTLGSPSTHDDDHGRLYFQFLVNTLVFCLILLQFVVVQIPAENVVMSTRNHKKEGKAFTAQQSRQGSGNSSNIKELEGFPSRDIDLQGHLRVRLLCAERWVPGQTIQRSRFAANYLDCFFYCLGCHCFRIFSSLQYVLWDRLDFGADGVLGKIIHV
jgi:hypothetical protein